MPVADLHANCEPNQEGTGRKTLEETEREHILATSKETKWIVSGPRGAASRLGMNRSTLQFRMRKLGIVRLLDAVMRVSALELQRRLLNKPNYGDTAWFELRGVVINSMIIELSTEKEGRTDMLPSARIENLLMIITDELYIARIDRENVVGREVLSRETLAKRIDKMRHDLNYASIGT